MDNGIIDNGSIRGSIFFRNSLNTVAGLEDRNKSNHYQLTNYQLSIFPLSIFPLSIIN